MNGRKIVRENGKKKENTKADQRYKKLLRESKKQKEEGELRLNFKKSLETS